MRSKSSVVDQAELLSEASSPQEGSGVEAPRVSTLLSHPTAISALIHLALVAVALTLVWIRPKRDRIRMTIREVPAEVKQAPVAPVISAAPKAKPKPVEKKRREVFGVSRKSMTSTASTAIEVKAGNTIAKAPDQEKLRPEDEDALPIPTDEFLVTQMPKLLSEVRIPYPPEAKQKAVQGAVVMELLIDSDGRVRNAELIEGPGFGLNEAALAAVKGFRFSAAKVQEQAVAVKIRYAYRFLLEK